MPLIGWDKLSLLIPYGRTQVGRFETDPDYAHVRFPKRIPPYDPRLREIVTKDGRPRIVGYPKAMWDLAEVVSWINSRMGARTPSGEIALRPSETVEELNARLDAIIKERKRKTAADKKAARDAATASPAAEDGTASPPPAP